MDLLLFKIWAGYVEKFTSLDSFSELKSIICHSRKISLGSFDAKNCYILLLLIELDYARHRLNG